MMYNEKLVAVIKCEGKVLREFDGKVYIPFGSEYSVLLSNLCSRKAVIDVTIDGEDVLDGQRLMLDGNSTMNLEGFLKGKKVANKFKFIEKTSKIEAYRGNKVQDGLVKVTYCFEEPEPYRYYPTYIYVDRFDMPNYEPFNYYEYTCKTESSRCSCTVPNKSNTTKAANRADFCVSDVSLASSCVNEDGITGKGSASSQEFSIDIIGTLESKEHTIVLKLKGQTEKSPIDRPIFTKTKQKKCELCGTNNKINSKFCNECGNALVMFV